MASSKARSRVIAERVCSSRRIAVTAEHVGDEGLADGLAAPAMELIEDLGDLAAAVIGEQSLEAEDLAADPRRFGRREREVRRSGWPAPPATRPTAGASQVVRRHGLGESDEDQGDEDGEQRSLPE